MRGRRTIRPRFATSTCSDIRENRRNSRRSLRQRSRHGSVTEVALVADISRAARGFVDECGAVTCSACQFQLRPIPGTVRSQPVSSGHVCVKRQSILGSGSGTKVTARRKSTKSPCAVVHWWWIHSQRGETGATDRYVSRSRGEAFPDRPGLVGVSPHLHCAVRGVPSAARSSHYRGVIGRDALSRTPGAAE
jgi:hypothetical protein